MIYKLDWKGLDQGVEHTWRPEVILGVLKTIAKNAPVKHREPDSAFYDEIEALFPNKTWRSYDIKDGSFRPIFRRSNTWKKLGLIVESDKEFTLSSSGSQLLANQILLSDIYSNVFRNHIEAKEKPFVILASLLVALPIELHNIDCILQLLNYWRPGDDLDEAIIKYKLKEQDKTDKEYKIRKRRIKSMLKLFLSMGCLNLSGGEIKVINKTLLSDIGKLSDFEDYLYNADESSSAKSKRSITANARKRGSGKSDIKKFAYDAANTNNPEKRIRLLERATQGHEDTVSLVAEYFEFKGYDSYEHPFAYDLHTPIDEQHGYLFEVKTINEHNCYKQIREAVSQLHEYHFRYKNIISIENDLVIVVDRNPIDLLENWIFDYLENDRNILLMWFENGVPTTINIALDRINKLKST